MSGAAQSKFPFLSAMYPSSDASAEYRSLATRDETTRGQCGTSSFNGRALWTTGMRAKLYAGGGEVVAHSRVSAFHGSSSATLPCFSITFFTTLKMNIETERAMMYTPIVEMRLSRPHSGACT